MIMIVDHCDDDDNSNDKNGNETFVMVLWSRAVGECHRKECFISWSGNHKTSYDRKGQVRSPLDLSQ